MVVNTSEGRKPECKIVRTRVAQMRSLYFQTCNCYNQKSKSFPGFKFMSKNGKIIKHKIKINILKVRCFGRANLH